MGEMGSATTEPGIFAPVSVVTEVIPGAKTAILLVSRSRDITCIPPTRHYSYCNTKLWDIAGIRSDRSNYRCQDGVITCKQKQGHYLYIPPPRPGTAHIVTRSCGTSPVSVVTEVITGAKTALLLVSRSRDITCIFPPPTRHCSYCNTKLWDIAGIRSDRSNSVPRRRYYL
ncbi:hypothetical protein J6590_036093 [Homalodisca vitripennis]|nr:hypothetical protein J6590_036093 [Homalodisca vitripennis]